MIKNKVFIIVVSILIAITLILTAAFVLWNFMEKSANTGDSSDGTKAAVEKVKPAKELTSLQMKENMVIIKDITTNLGTANRFIKVSFAFEMENKKTKDDFENLLDSKVKGTIVSTLADMTAEQIQGSKGFDNLTSQLMNKLNPLLKQGKIKQIWVTDIGIQ